MACGVLQLQVNLPPLWPLQSKKVSAGPVTRHSGLLPERTSGRKTFLKSLDWGYLGVRGGKQGAHSALGFSVAPTLDPGGGRVQRQQGSCVTSPPSHRDPCPGRTGELGLG